ncbi:MAG: hypothetical protein Q8861_01960 [Bacteroidota bacterium]|nr:hypothetical protein [Bacteroidota bacterium]
MFGNVYNEDIEIKNAPVCNCGGSYDFSKVFELRSNRFVCFYARCKQCGKEYKANTLKELLSKL